MTTFTCLCFVPILLSHHSHFCTDSNFPFPLPTHRPTDSKGFPPLQPHGLTLNHITLLYRLHWCGSDRKKRTTYMNRCGRTFSWTPSVPEEVSLQLSSFTDIWPLPLFFKEKATGQLEGSQGWDLAHWLATGHTLVGYILDGNILQPSHWNSDTWTYSRFVGAKSRSVALRTSAIEPSTGRAKSRVLVTEPSLILCFTLNCHWLLLFWKITLKVSHIQMSAWTLYLLQKPAKWSCSWLWLYLSFQVVTFTEIDKHSPIRRGIYYPSQFSCGP